MERTLHRDYYFSDEIFQREQERIFYREWFCAWPEQSNCPSRATTWCSMLPGKA